MSEQDRASGGRWVDFGGEVRAFIDMDLSNERDAAAIFEKSLVALEIDGDCCADLTPEVKGRLLQTNWKGIAEWILTTWLAVAQTVVVAFELRRGGCEHARHVYN